LLVACADSGGDPSGVDTSNATSAADTSASASSDSSSGIVATSTSADSSGDASESTGAAILFCGLADLKPSATDPIESGLGAMQIPPDIAAIQVGNCGCHLADALEVADVPDYPSTGPFDMTTWTGFQAERMSDSMPYHVIAHGHVMSEFMPLSTYCNVGGGEGMPPDQRATLVEWLSMGAPDGATWEP
jgi:hypothetical protein